jgi:hypothetical protein
LFCIALLCIALHGASCSEEEQIQDNTEQCKAMESKAEQSNAKQCKGMQCKAMQSNAKQCKATLKNVFDD